MGCMTAALEGLPADIRATIDAHEWEGVEQIRASCLSPVDLQRAGLLPQVSRLV